MQIQDSWKLFAGVDVIGGVTKQTTKKPSTNASYFVLIVVAVTPSGKRIPVTIYRKRRLTFSQQVEVIKKFSYKYSPLIIAIEDNNAQRWIVNHLMETTDCPVKGFATTVNKYDPDYGIPSLALEFENGKWIIPYLGKSTQEIMDVFMEELKGYPVGKTTDILMATWICLQGIRSIEKNVMAVKKLDKFAEAVNNDSEELNIYERVVNNLI